MTDVDDPGEEEVASRFGEGGRARARKAPSAFRTISEVTDELHIPQHVLRFWETRFPQVKPLKRGGGRRYYRPEDIALLRSIAHLLYVQGYTIKGVQRLLREGSGTLRDDIPPANEAERYESSAERAGLEAMADEAAPDLLGPPPLAPAVAGAASPVSSASEPAWSGDDLEPADGLAIPTDGIRTRDMLREILSELEGLRRLFDPPR